MSPSAGPTGLHDLSTPALVVDAATLDHNLTTMAEALPGDRCRPHVKAHKTTELARRQHEVGHPGFTCATPGEAIGLARAGLGGDLLVANEVLDVRRLEALAALVADDDARIAVAVDSEPTVDAAARAGLREVVVDVMVGLPRCGCLPTDAGRIAELARAKGLEVRGVMGYEGQITVIEDRDARSAEVDRAMEQLRVAHDAVGGELISAGATVSYDLNTYATEVQAGSYALMDTAFERFGTPFRRALYVWSTVVSVLPDWAVVDCGLKSLGMDHGDPTIEAGDVLVVSDEHVTFVPHDDHPVEVGDRVRVWPAHVDPTVAYHDTMHVADGETIVDHWPVDLRGW